jgi:hypothetical protein
MEDLYFDKLPSPPAAAIFAAASSITTKVKMKLHYSKKPPTLSTSQYR